MLLSSYKTVKSLKSNTPVTIALAGNDLIYDKHKTFIALRK